MKQVMFIFTIIGTLLLTTSCSGNKLKGTQPPIPVVEINSVTIPVYLGGYCWYECADAPSIPEIVEREVPIMVNKGTNIVLDFDHKQEPSDITITRMKQGEDQLYNQTLTVPSVQGIYYFEINARWNYDDLEADSAYAFVIEVK